MRFRQKNRAKCETILKSIQPNKFFKQPRFVIQVNRSINGFACARVEWIEFITEINPQWMGSYGSKSLMLLSEQEYETKIAVAALEIEVQKNGTPAKTVLTDKTLFRFVMTSGKKLFGETTHLIPEYGPEPNVIYGKRDMRRHVLINPQNIIQWKVDWGQAEIRRQVWEAGEMEMT